MSREPDHDRQQELFEAAQRLASVGGWEYDLNTERFYWTDEVRRIYELPPEYEPTLQEAIEFFHPADEPAVHAAIDAAVDDGESFEAEWRLETAEDNRRWVRVHGTPQREAGKTVRLQGAVVDITDRKQHKQRLTSLFETGRELLDASTVEEIASLAVESAREVLGLSANAVYLYDDASNVLRPTAVTSEATDTIAEIPTFDPGEGIAWSAFERGEPQVYDDVRTASEVYNPDTPIRSELAVPLGDHGVFLAGSTKQGAFDDRTLSLANILAADIETALDQRARQTELRETTERLETIIQHTPDSLFVLDDEGHVIEANDQACESLGYDSDGDDSFECSALLGSHWSAFGTITDIVDSPADGESTDGDSVDGESTPAEDESTDGESTPEMDVDPFAALRENPETVITIEGRHTRQDGTTFPVRVRITRIDHNGEGAFLAIARDISELTAQQKQLRRQNEQLDQFASVISHDLRSPLSVAKSGVEVARRKGEGHGESLERVGRAHDRMGTLIENLLTLAKNGQTMETADLESVDLSAVVRRSWQTVSTEGAELCIEDDCRLVADESRLRQLLENLFRNSVEHGTSSRTQSKKDDAELTVRVGTLSEGVYIEDDGQGISEAAREEIFEPGYTTHEEGTGYGLEIVRTVAEAHDWEITVTDAAEGGARFELTGIESLRPTE